MNQQLFEAVDNYICDLVAPEDDALKATVESIEKNGIPQISISASQGKFLQVLAKLCNAKKILEVGTLAGYSTIWMARALPKDGKLISLEYEQLHADVARENIKRAGLDNIVEIRVGKAIDLLPELAKENMVFDMIFIDADKEPYAEYFQWALKLSHSGTLIIADNVIREGKVLEENPDDERVAGVHRFNKLLAATKEVTACIIQNVGAKEHDGMAIAVVN
ncbi:O-methyltransferase [Panacibacter ginsenosidivorans]|uniref:O-methyltransferase n=1 Tax=Panacibacter ginsenosidivorans TaxID=1813871 RepID=A0A5B8VEY6_9BACT|nr:O-methyltransferase [Panacibacter ginsenosidivorans]QEC69643.1 O-methyltransferase [Panacibacter ginsenosidivorans]